MRRSARWFVFVLVCILVGAVARSTIHFLGHVAIIGGWPVILPSGGWVLERGKGDNPLTSAYQAGKRGRPPIWYEIGTSKQIKSRMPRVISKKICAGNRNCVLVTHFDDGDVLCYVRVFRLKEGLLDVSAEVLSRRRDLGVRFSYWWTDPREMKSIADALIERPTAHCFEGAWPSGYVPAWRAPVSDGPEIESEPTQELRMSVGETRAESE